MNKILDIFRDLPFLKRTIPIWLMRQAGRYLPEYMEVRSRQTSFIDFCLTPADVEQVTLQPVERFDLDAAIIFSDILTIPYLLGYRVEFTKGEGPQLFRPAFIESKELANIEQKLANIYLAINNVRRKLAKNKSLIGFSGAPWTLMCYMYTDGSKAYANVKQLAYNGDKEFYQTLELVKQSIILHLKAQIRAGADLVQIFDSWAGLLDEYHFKILVTNQLKEIVEEVRKEFPAVPIIVFAKDAGLRNFELAELVKPSAISLSYTEDIEFFAKNLPKTIVTQGNLDPIYLQTENTDSLQREVERILGSVEGRRHIFNLGHGINPLAKIENIHRVIDIVRSYEK